MGTFSQLLLPLLFGCLLLPTIQGCISFGSFPEHEEHKDEKPEQLSTGGGEEIRRKEEKGKLVSGENAEVGGGETKEELPQLNDAFVKTYLKEFGYLKGAISATKSKELDEESTRAIRHFQEFMGVIPATGKMDFQSTNQMVRKRCSNPDLLHSEDLNPIWERSSLKWHLLTDNTNSSLPKGFDLLELREMIRQAFSAWEIVISMEFLEETNASNADIVFIFGGEETMNNVRGGVGSGNKTDRKPHVPSAATGLGVAYGTEPLQSRIWLHRNENWSTFQVQEEGKLDIFLVLIHEIGHTLGLRHSSDKNSVMFPIFEKDAGEQLPVISNDDVERLRTLYDPSENGPDPADVDDESSAGRNQSSSNTSNVGKSGKGVLNVVPAATLPSLTDDAASQTSSPPAEKCPRALWAITQASDGEFVVFMDVNCWRFTKQRMPLGGGGPKPISEVFPGGPTYVDVAISAGNLTVLLQERTLYGYTVENGEFRPAKGFPRSLHSRVLFFPDAAFPLANGSVIFLRDNVFATYDLTTNEPTMLNDKTVYFPNLPQDIRAGVLQHLGGPGMEEKTFYWVFNGESVLTYDPMLQKVLNEQTLADFLKCQQPSESAEKIRPKSNVVLNNGKKGVVKQA